MPEYTITLSEEEEKAILWDCKSVQEKIDNDAHNKARQCIDEICRIALEDHSHKLLTVTEKQDVARVLAVRGEIITTVKRLPGSIKRQIVAAARVKSAVERQAEEDAEMGIG